VAEHARLDLDVMVDGARRWRTEDIWRVHEVVGEAPVGFPDSDEWVAAADYDALMTHLHAEPSKVTHASVTLADMLALAHDSERPLLRGFAKRVRANRRKAAVEEAAQEP
jgi:hypothetical protein